MKYTVSIEIALPREKVVELLTDPVHLPKWLRGLVVHEPLTGVHGKVGTTSRVVLRMGSQEMEITETITRSEPADASEMLPDEVVHYDREMVATGMWSVAREQLMEAGSESTLWVSANEYRFDGVVMRLLAPLMRRAFVKQSLQHMQDFKAYAERGRDVRDGTT